MNYIKENFFTIFLILLILIVIFAMGFLVYKITNKSDNKNMVIKEIQASINNEDVGKNSIINENEVNEETNDLTYAEITNNQSKLPQNSTQVVHHKK